MRSKTVLEKEAFQTPTDLKPEDLDWATSRPIKPWFVRRGAHGLHGFWHLARLDLLRIDVNNVLCGMPASDAPVLNTAQRTNRDRSSVEEVGRPDTEEARKSIQAGIARHRGRRPIKREATEKAMRLDIQAGRVTWVKLSNMLEKQLSDRYGVSRDVARKARNAVLSEFRELHSRQNPTNDK
jgi:hypothetical protein